MSTHFSHLDRITHAMLAAQEAEARDIADAAGYVLRVAARDPPLPPDPDGERRKPAVFVELIDGFVVAAWLEGDPDHA